MPPLAKLCLSSRINLHRVYSAPEFEAVAPRQHKIKIAVLQPGLTKEEKGEKENEEILVNLVV